MPAVCQSLIEEHEVIERVLTALGQEIDRIDEGAAVERFFFDGALAFVREFADGIHHRKEENILFPKMLEAGMPREGGPVSVMLKEHTMARAHIRAMGDALAGAVDGDANARRTLIQEARAYINLLRAHIQKENNILFPMAEHIFNPVAKATIYDEFTRAESKEAAVIQKRREWVDSLNTPANA